MYEHKRAPKYKVLKSVSDLRNDEPFCLLTSTNVTRDFVNLQRIADDFGYMQFYFQELEESRESYFTCRNGTFETDVTGSSDTQELIDYVTFEFENRQIGRFDKLNTMYHVELYKTPVMVWVKDNTTTDSESREIEWNMKQAYEQIMILHKEQPKKYGRAFLKWAYKEDLTDHFKERFNNTQTPFTFMTESNQAVNKPYYHIYPGKQCQKETIVPGNITSSQNITDFVKRLYEGKLFPEIKNQNLTEFMSNITIAESFENFLNPAIELVNAQMVNNIV